jgi:hypothetical protein
MRLIFLRPLLALALLAVLAGVGCGGAQPSRRGTYRSRDNQFVSIEHVNQMSAAFELIGLRVVLDGAPVFEREGELALPSPLCATRTLASPGPHQIRVVARYRGHGAGVFSYLNDYHFTASGETRVEIPPDAYGLALQSSGYEGGGPTTPLEERPQLRFTATPELANPAGGCRP